MSETMVAVSLILAAIIPGLVLIVALNCAALQLRGGFRWRFGRPWWVIFFAFAMGVASAWPAYWLEHALTKAPWERTNLGMWLLFWLVVAGFVEETCKFTAFHIPARLTSWFREEYDGILIAATVALGFATIENLLYVREHGFEVAKVRAFTAVPAHAMFGVIMGAYLGMAKARARLGWSDMGLPLSGLAIAVFAHGFYDLLISQKVTTPMVVAVVVFLVALVAVSFRLCLHARRRSPSFGGRRFVVPPPQCSLRLPPVPVARNPWIAGALGLVPGLGQAYNGEPVKSTLFFLVGSVNLALYWIAHMFVYDVAGAIQFLERLGVDVAVRPEQLGQAIQQKWLLEPILLYLVLAWELVGALDAWSTARRQWHRPQTHSVKRSFAAHGLGTSYVLHLVAIFLIVIAPIAEIVLGGGSPQGSPEKQESGVSDASKDAGSSEGDSKTKAGGGDDGTMTDVQAHKDWKLTWVQKPDHIEGWDNKPEGTKDGSEEAPAPSVEAAPTGDGAIPSGNDGERPLAGEHGSYNQYISHQIRRNHTDGIYFRNVPRNRWAIVHYRIARDGRLIESSLVSCNGPNEDGMRAVEVIRRSAPYQSLPGDARELEVTELFWSLGYNAFTPGSLEWKLSRLPDGRLVKAIQ